MSSATPDLVWTNPDATDGNPSLLRLTAESLLAAAVPREELDRVVAAVGGGAAVAGQVIPLPMVTKLEGDEDDPTLTVTYRSGGSTRATVDLTLAGAAKREELIGALIARLGPDWRRRRQPTSPWAASLGILTAVGLVALATWGCYREAVQIAAGKHLEPNGADRKRQLLSQIAHWVEGLIGPTGILVVGGVLVALGLLAVVCLLIYPPVRVVVEPSYTPEKAAEPAATPDPAT
jgi:hypothetical protein